MKKKALCVLLALLLFSLGCSPESLPEEALPTAAPAKLSFDFEAPSVSDFSVEPVLYLVPSPEPDRLDAKDGVYTIAWLSDPQHYSKAYPATFYTMTYFLKKEQARLNLGYVVCTGDLVHEDEKTRQWEIADGAMAQIDAIPHGVLAGNHDVRNNMADYGRFCAYFGEARYREKTWYGESYQDNRGHYDLIRLGNTDYVFVYMGYAPDRKAYDWIKGVFDQYPERVGILCVHDYFTTSGMLSDAGEQFYEKVLKTCPNVYMLLCGHRYNQLVVPAYFDDDSDGTSDRTVYQMMNNYQAAGAEGGSGYMRFFQVDEEKSEIRVYSYSPLTKDYNYFDSPESQLETYPADPTGEEFVIPIPWQKTE